MKIISLDPGKSTGVTYWEYSDNTHDLRLLKSEVILNYLDFDWSILKDYDLVIYEDFLLYPGKAKSMIFNRFIPAQVIGVIKYYSYKYKKPVVVQRAVDVKKAISNEALKFFKCYTKITHTRDSARHAIYYFVKNYQELSINGIDA